MEISCHIIVYYLEYCTANREVLIFYADQLMVMGSSKNSHVFNFAILLKSRKFDAREIYMCYNTLMHTWHQLLSDQHNLQSVHRVY